MIVLTDALHDFHQFLAPHYNHPSCDFTVFLCVSVKQGIPVCMVACWNIESVVPPPWRHDISR
jgi:hypothetical protein